jgi:hypothetical protein
MGENMVAPLWGVPVQALPPTLALQLVPPVVNFRRCILMLSGVANLNKMKQELRLVPK